MQAKIIIYSCICKWTHVNLPSHTHTHTHRQTHRHTHTHTQTHANMKEKCQVTVATADDYDFVHGVFEGESGGSWGEAFVFTASLLKRRNIALYTFVFGVFLLLLGFPLPIVFGCASGMKFHFCRNRGGPRHFFLRQVDVTLI